ncbi:MAG TPA: GNAT family N-acetyltransferase [Firmicutes bacterium]|nr:GNAT family N-acetyltransferase [Bacillota bacterium]
MAAVIETERLLLREMTQDDWQDLAWILQGPEVMYAYGHGFSSGDVKAQLDRRGGTGNTGLACGPPCEKRTTSWPGRPGLPCSRTGAQRRWKPEIGCLLIKKCWHRGYAGEAVPGCKM